MRVALVHGVPVQRQEREPWALTLYLYWQLVLRERLERASAKVRDAELAYLVGCAFADGDALQRERESAWHSLQAEIVGRKRIVADAIAKSRAMLAEIEARERRDVAAKSRADLVPSLSDKVEGRG